jgi:hypothetical protein
MISGVALLDLALGFLVKDHPSKNFSEKKGS